MKKGLLPILLALVLGVATFFVGRRVLNNQTAAPKPVEGTIVLAAARPLPGGHQLTADDLKPAKTPVENITASMFREATEVESRVLAAPVEEGQILRQSLLAPEGTSSALQAKVPAGMRAVTVGVNEFSGLAGLITPGVRVDLIATLVDTVTNETFARTIVENVLVSAIGQNLESGKKEDLPNGARAQKTVTLLVTPTQAEAIDLAFTKSRPRLVLRSGGDEAPVEQPGVTLAELAGRTSRNRLTEEAAEKTGDVMEMLKSMREEMAKAARANEEAAREAVLAAMRQDEAPGVDEPTVQLHSVRLIRGGQVEHQEFDAEGRPTGSRGGPSAQPETPGATPKETERERQQVRIDDSAAADTTASVGE